MFEQGGKYSMWFFSGFMNNKEHEFLFDIPMSFNSEDLIPLQEDEYQDFRFIHEIENKNASWTYWKKKIKNYQIYYITFFTILQYPERKKNSART